LSCGTPVTPGPAVVIDPKSGPFLPRSTSSKAGQPAISCSSPVRARGRQDTARRMALSDNQQPIFQTRFSQHPQR
jgi:hypothetical protein